MRKARRAEAEALGEGVADSRGLQQSAAAAAAEGEEGKEGEGKEGEGKEGEWDAAQTRTRDSLHRRRRSLGDAYAPFARTRYLYDLTAAADMHKVQL